MFYYISDHLKQFPIPFVESLRGIMPGDECAMLLETLGNEEKPVSVRFNPFKLGDKPGGGEVPWCRYGRYLDHRPQFTLDPRFHGGEYYVQEASSMFVEHLLREATGNRTEGLTVLDLCAAPGGKTTLLSTLVGPEGVVVANETIRQRAGALADNVRKWGVGNVVVTSNDPSHLGALEHAFDVVLIDAPCSGEGMFRKSPEVVDAWSEETVRLCAARQRRILADVWPALKPGGVLIYSTCTFNRTENEENIEWLIDQYDCDVAEVEVDPSWGVACGEVGGVNTFRFFPHRVRGEGFFAAVLYKGEGRRRKTDHRPRRTPFSDAGRQAVREAKSWVGQPEYMHFQMIGEQLYGYYNAAFPRIKYFSENLSAIYSGVEMGQLYSGRLKPSHALALFHGLSRDAVAGADLLLPEALAYLARQDSRPDLFAEGINLVTFSGLPIGWAKRIGGRVNNLYPTSQRILKLSDG